jgi:two-component system, chemotaxis family, protein-glutamate methylesterase/glutaminase
MPPDPEERTEAIIQEQIGAIERGEGTDRPALVSCPDCGGTIWRFQVAGLTQFQCREGHRYTAESFLERQAEDIEQTLWAGVRLLEERAMLARKFATHAREHQDPAEEARWTREAEAAQREGRGAPAATGLTAARRLSHVLLNEPTGCMLTRFAS